MQKRQVEASVRPGCWHGIIMPALIGMLAGLITTLAIVYAATPTAFWRLVDMVLQQLGRP